jgi:YegS/Rv2252/BmrU family lipid kinase
VKVRAILNPRAGLTAERALAALRRGRPSWSDVTVELTTGPGDARTMAQDAARENADLVLSVGGDGTANEAAQGLIDTPTVLGVVPVGSGNGLARCLRIPLQPPRALEALEGGVVRPIDVGLANGSVFLNVSGVGFDAQVGVDFHEAGRRGGRRGIGVYVLLSALRILRYKAEPLVVEANGARIETRPFIVCAANGPQYGAGAVIAKGARLDDGRFDLAIVEDASLLAIAANVPRVFAGRLDGSRLYRRIATARASLISARPVAFHRDGEPEPPVARLELGLRPKALRILVPRATAADPNGPFTPEGSIG